MIQFNGSAQLPDNSPKTIQELVQAAIAARTYGTQAQEDDAVNRFGGGRTISEGFMRPEGGDIYMMDAYKNVTNGQASATGWTLPGDFTAVPGGGEPVTDGTDKHFNNGVDPGSRVLWQNTGAAVTIYFDLSFI